MKEKKVNLFVSIGLILISIVFLAFIPKQVKGGGSLLASSKVLPIASLGLIILLSLILAIQTLIEMKRKTLTSEKEEIASEESNGSNQKASKKILLVVLGSVCLFGTFVFTLKSVGYLISTFLFVLFFNRLLGEKNWLKSIALAAIITILFYWFTYKVTVFMPKGILKNVTIFY